MYAMFILNLIVPLVMIFIGYIMKKHPVLDMSRQNGYNTPVSRRSQEHWDYAQSIAPEIYTGLGKILLIIEVLVSIALFLIKVKVETSIMIGIAIGAVFILLGFYIIDSKILEKLEGERDD